MARHRPLPLKASRRCQPELDPEPATAPPGVATERRRYRDGRDPQPGMVRRWLMPTASAVTVGVMTVGAALVVTGTSTQAAAQEQASALRPATGAGFAPTDVAEPESAFVPSPAVAAAIADAVRTSPLTAAVPADDYEVVNTRIAASDPSWAWTELTPTAADVDRVEAVVHQVDGRWDVAQLGSFEVGCGVAPPQVLEDLDLYCPCAEGDAPAYDA